MQRSQVVRALLVGGPMYDGLYEILPSFERQTGFKVEVVARLPHPELNARIFSEFTQGKPDFDLLSTHTKYAPSQAKWLSSLDQDLPSEDVADLLPRPRELARIEGHLMQVPRNLDMRLLYYRRDLFEDAELGRLFEKSHKTPLQVPETWKALVEVAAFLTRPGLHGFLFPGRDSGLFGTFYELLVSAGGELFGPDLGPAFDSAEGIWAADFLAELHYRRRVTPEELPRWHYDEVSEAFRVGHAAMVCDWPGSHYLYKEPRHCAFADRVGLALLPAGPSLRRAAYAGCHSFAVTRDAPNRRGGVELLRFLTSPKAQWTEARRGAMPVRASALAQIRAEVQADASAAHRFDLLTQTTEFLIIPPRFSAYPACEDALWRSLQKAMTGFLSPAAAIREAFVEVEEIVRRYREEEGSPPRPRAPLE